MTLTKLSIVMEERSSWPDGAEPMSEGLGTESREGADWDDRQGRWEINGCYSADDHGLRPSRPSKGSFILRHPTPSNKIKQSNLCLRDSK